MGDMLLVVGFVGLVLFCVYSVRAQEEEMFLSVPGEGLRQDAEALLAFGRGIESDPSGGLRDWGAHVSPCHWHGVECASQGSSATAAEEDRVVGLELWGLELEGSISSQIGMLSELRKLVIVGNKFRGGQIPVEIQKCRKLSTLDLRANELSGVIGFRLADLPRLQVLKLSENRLSGTLNALFSADRSRYSSYYDSFRFVEEHSSSSTGSCSSLQALDLAQNALSGKLPAAIGGCAQLQEVSLKDNMFTGAIPPTLSAILHLRALLLNKNLLDGSLPSSIAAGCKKLQFLNVADNRLSGRIPVEFAEFGGAREFNFSNNLFEGPIPLGKWYVQQMALAGCFSSNSGLCGWPSTQVCESPRMVSHDDPSLSLKLSSRGSLWFEIYARMQRLRMALVGVQHIGRARLARALRTRRSMADARGGSPASAPAPSSGGGGHKHTARRWALGLVLGLVAGAIAAALLATILRLCVFYIRKAPYMQGPIIFHPSISPKMLAFLDKDDALNETQLVGVGGAGRVYKAHLENEMVVAVKRVVVKEDQQGLFGQKQIRAELETLGCIRHRNLVVLLAYVHRPDSHLLLYEYMENGSLHHALQKVDAGELEFPWPVRHKVAVGTAQGLSYLHFHCNPRIVHRDLKPSNILLDTGFTARVSDFGLAKVVPGADTHVSTLVAGTVGYIAPEYSQTWRFTDRSDVYSFGVVLAVLLTGKDPTAQFFETACGGSIGSWLHDLLQKGEGRDAIDRRLLEGSSAQVEEEILLAMKIAVFCTSANPCERPSSKEVLIMLNQIRPEAEP